MIVRGGRGSYNRKMSLILFDIGGTKMRIAYSTDGQSFEAPQTIKTPELYDDGVKAFVDLARICSNGRPIEKIAGGIAGPFDERKSTLVGSPNLKDWIGKPLKEALQKELQAPVTLENDSAVVGLGEAVSGAGKDFGIVAYITVSTGVGGARIINGKIDEKAIGFEPGHQIMDIKNGDTLQNLVGGRALEIRTGKKPKDITDPNLWDEYAKLLAMGLNNTIVHWSPDILVLGGSMITGNPAIPVDKTENYLKDILKIYPEVPVIKKAELGDFGGLYGALQLLR